MHKDDPPRFLAEISDAPGGARTRWALTEDGKRLRVVIWGDGPRGTAVIFSGRSEYVEKYGRVIRRLVERGFSVLAFDWRGQGLSTRPTHGRLLGHVDDFRHYQRDWAAVRAVGESEGLPRPFLMVAHSMGGCIGLRSLIEDSGFAAAAFSAPMWRLQMRTVTRHVTNRLARAANLVGLGTRRMPGTKREPSAIALPFENNALTSCAEHFMWFGRQLATEPGLGLAGPSVQWTYAALEEMTRLSVAPAMPSVPVMTFVGSEEAVVSPGVIRAQMARMPQGALVELRGARHEIWMERPAIQAEVWRRLDEFLDAVAPRSRGSARDL
jgi:lysophospholipase